MGNDRFGLPASVGQVYLLAGTARRIEGSTDMLLTLGAGATKAIRVRQGDVCPVDRIDFTNLAPMQDGSPTGFIMPDGAGGWTFVGITWPDGALVQMDSAKAGGIYYVEPGPFLEANEATARSLLQCPYTQQVEAGDPVRTVGASSTAEANVVSMTLPASSLGTTGRAVLECVGDMLNNSGSSNNVRLRVKIGSTTVYDKTSPFTTATQPRPFVWRVHVCAKGSTSKQRVVAEMHQGYAFTGTSGFGDWGNFNGPSFVVQGDATENQATNLAVTVSIQNDVSNANIYHRLYSARLILQP